MPFDTYIKIQDIKGESTASGMDQGHIEIYSFSIGASAPVTVGPGTGGISASRVSISSFNIMKKTDTSSADLFTACCNGTHIPLVEVFLRKQTGKGGQDSFLIYKFSDVMVESVQWSGSSGGDDTPTESVSLAFAKIEIEYKKQGKDGKLATAGQAAWDLTKVSDK